MASIPLPDGSVVHNVPDGMDMNSMMSVLKQANPKAYREILARTEGMGPAVEPSRLARFGRGMVDPVAGARQILPEAVGGFSPAQAAEEHADVARFERGTGGGFDPFRIAGQAATLAPAAAISAPAKAGLLARTAVGAAQGGAGGGLLYAKSPDERVAQAAGGALGGGIFAAAGPPVAAAFGKGLGAAREVGRRVLNPRKVMNTVTVELEEAAESAGIKLADLSKTVVTRMKRDAAKSLNRTGKSNAAELVRVEKAKQFGFMDDAALTKGQASRDPRQFSDEQNLSKLDEIGDELTGRFSSQRAKVDENLEGFRSTLSQGAEDVSPFTAGEAVEGAAKDVAKAMQKKVSAAYKAAEDAMPDLELSRDYFKNRTAGILQDFEDNIPSGVKTRIGKLLADEADEGRRFTPGEAAKLDKLITDTLPSDPFAKTERLAARQLQEAIADSMEEAGGRAGEFGGLYRAAKKVASERFKAIGDPRHLTAKLVSETFDPEKVTGAMMGGSVRQVQNLTKFLSDRPEALAQARASVIQDILERSTPSGNFSQAAYNRVVKKVGQKRLETIFGDKTAAKQLIEFGEVARDLFSFPAGHRVNTSNTAPTGANMIGKAMGAISELVPGGRILAGLRAAGEGEAVKKLKMKMVTEALNPKQAPIPNLLDPAGTYSARVLGPTAGGLLGAERLRRER